MMVGIVRGKTPEVILNKLMNVKNFREKAVKVLSKCVKEECKLLCSKNNPLILRGSTTEDIHSTDFLKIANELKEKAPVFSQMLKDTMNTTKPVGLVSSAAVILHHRNHSMSLIRHVVGQLLDYGGATDETQTIDLLRCLGFSVGCSATHKKQVSLIDIQKKKTENTLLCQVHQSILQFNKKKHKEMVFALHEKEATDSSNYFAVSSQLQCICSSVIMHLYFDMNFSTAYVSDTATVTSTMSCYTKDSCNYLCRSTVPQACHLPPPNMFTKVGLAQCLAVSKCSNFEVDPYRGVAQSNDKSTVLYGKKYISQIESRLKESEIQPPFDIIGDNLDFLKSTSSMTKEKQRKMYQWFILVGLQRRVLDSTMFDVKPKHDILSLPNHSFLPNAQDINILERNMNHHILKVITRHVKCLKSFAHCVPKHIEHPFMEETSKRSTHVILDLLDKNQNFHDDTISILEHIHQKYITQNLWGKTERRVFGGDVLTNERAYTAQLDMQNCGTDFYKLGGLIHRPEGLHRMMNFLLFIYQEFYKPSSSFEQGTLYHLRNVIHREDVTGKDEVVRAYRAHYAFVEDALDAFILGATMDVMGLNDLNGSPQQWNPSILSMYSNKKQLSWLRNLAETVINKHINLQGTTHLQDLVEEAAKLDSQNDMLHSMFDAAINQYICTCQKKYNKIGHFKRHLEKEHNWHFPTAAPKEPKKEDKVAVWRSSFMKAALILRDTCDAYEMGDGNRIFLNAKFEMLYANVAGHTKYQLWLWRMMAYEQAILTPKQAFEYKWNTTANLNGTIDGNIPNDTLVDICVQLVKKKIKEQDSNFTFDSAKNTALSCQIQDELRESNRLQVSMKPFGKSRTKARISSDINLMLTELMAGNIFKNIQGRQFKNFKNMKDVFEKVNLHKLYIWISKQKKRASYEMM